MPRAGVLMTRSRLTESEFDAASLRYATVGGTYEVTGSTLASDVVDFTGNVLNVGHSNPRVQAAVREQLDRFTHVCFQVAMYDALFVSGLERFLPKLRQCAARISTLFSEQQAEASTLSDGVAATPLAVARSA